MAEEESVNDVFETDSNGHHMPEKALDDMTEKKVLEADGGKVFENGVKDPKKDDLKEMAEDKKVGVQVMEVDKKDDGVNKREEDNKDDVVKEIEENKKVYVVKEIGEDKKDDVVKEMEEDKKGYVVKETEEYKKDGVVKEIEEDKKDDNGSGIKKMDEEIEIKETEDSKEEKEQKEAEEPEVDAMEEDGTPNDKEGSGEKEKVEEGDEEGDEGNDDGPQEEEKAEERKADKRLKKRGKAKINGERVKEKSKVLKEMGPRTPAIDRPVRERKSVERFVASMEKDAAKEFQIEKGRGTPLKDIPNVAYKLSRRKTDDTFRLLHTILFGRRGKAVQIKSNILRFSGFVWHENEEKQKTKLREKFDKCNKEKLLEFCDVLDIPMTKTTTRKEDIVTKLIDFLMAPHATTTVLLAEKESNKSKKRKRVTKRGSSTSGIRTSKCSTKSQNKIEDSSAVEERNSATETEDELGEEEKEDEEDEENDNDVSGKSEDEMPEQSESEGKSDSGNESEDVETTRKKSKLSTKKESAAKTKTKKITVTNKSRSPSKRTPKKSSSTHPKVDDNDGNPKVFSRKKKNEKEGKQKASTLTKSSSKEKTEKVGNGKGKNKEKLNPSDDQLQDAICEILKVVDFNTATFTDILKQLARQFDVDLTPRKASIKLMIQEELTKLADEADDEDDEADAEKDETDSAGQEVDA